MTTDTSIMNLTIDSFVTVLTQKLITEVDDEETEAEEVRAGKLQDDPTEGTGITILVHPNHQVDEGFRNEIATPDKGLDFPIYEIGGGSRFWRRYTVEFSLYDMGEAARSVSRALALVVMSRVENAIRTGGVCPVGPDTFGERAIFVQVEDSYIREGGGIGAFIWRGEVRCRTFNEVEGCL